MLVEKDGRGHAENFAPVHFRPHREGGDPVGVGARHEISLDPRFRGNDVVEALITAVDGDTLVGTPE